MLQEHILYTVQEVAEWLEEQFLWALDCYRAEREENDKMTRCSKGISTLLDHNFREKKLQHISSSSFVLILYMNKFILKDQYF